MPLETVNKIIDKKISKKIEVINNDFSDFPSIISDINALNSKERNTRSDARKRLTARGDEVAPDILLRIADTEATLLEKKRLISILGFISTPGTDKDIIEFAEMLRGLDEDVRKLKLKTVYFQSFRYLSKYDDTSAAIEYANKLLSYKGLDPDIYAQALFFLADQNIQEAKEWADIYNRNNISTDEKYALAYIGSKIGTRSGIQETINFLLNLPKSNNNYKYEIHKLLDSLTHTVDADELREIIRAIKKNYGRMSTDRKVNSYPLLSELYNGDEKERSKAALELLNGWMYYKDSTFESLKYMISINDTEPYINLWKLHSPVLVRFVNSLGYTIGFDNNIAMFIETPESYSYHIPDISVLVTSLMESFKNNDINSFKALLLPNEYAFELTTQDILSKSNKKDIDDLYRKFKTSVIDNWVEVIRKASSAGLNWTNIVYESKSIVLVGNGGLISRTTIHIEGSNKIHTIILENCVLFDNKWYVLSGMKWL